MVRECGKFGMVTRVVPPITGFSGGGLPVIAILLAGDLIPARTFYPYILGKERFGAVDEVERALGKQRRCLAHRTLSSDSSQPLRWSRAEGASDSNLGWSSEAGQNVTFPAPNLFPVGGRIPVEPLLLISQSPGFEAL
jgi:hypothetical protein